MRLVLRPARTKQFTEFSDAAILQQLGANSAAQEEVLSKVRTLAQETTQIRIRTKGHVLGNVTERKNHQEIILHLLNYDSEPAENLDIQLSLGNIDKSLVGKPVSLVSPDIPSSRLINVSWDGKTLRATLPSLKRYSVIVLK